MKLLFDLLPVVLFFLAFKIKGVFVATAVAIAASVLQISWMLIRRKKVEPLMWASLGIIAVFGGATLILHNETYIKWKPTILYWLTGAVLLGGQAFFKKNGMKGILGKQLTLPDKAWGVMNLSWGIFFAIIGCVNLAVAFTCSTDTWVNFKLFGIMGLIMAFAVAQSLILNKQQIAEKDKEGENLPS
jgi:intracellular septation protein